MTYCATACTISFFGVEAQERRKKTPTLESRTRRFFARHANELVRLCRGEPRSEKGLALVAVGRRRFVYSPKQTSRIKIHVFAAVQLCNIAPIALSPELLLFLLALSILRYRCQSRLRSLTSALEIVAGSARHSTSNSSSSSSDLFDIADKPHLQVCKACDHSCDRLRCDIWIQ